MKTLLFGFLFLLGLLKTTAQNVAINNDGSLPDPKAQLDVKSANKGVLLPRVTDVSVISGNVPLGLLVFVTDGDRGFYYNASALPGTPNWKKLIVPTDQYWFRNGVNLYPGSDITGNLGLGTTTPGYKLTVRQSGIGITQENSDGSAQIGFYTSGGAAYLQTHTNTPLSFATNNAATQMLLSTLGNVGIGTTTPALAGMVVDKKMGAVNALFGSNTTGVSIQSSFPGIGFNTYYSSGHYYIASGAGGYIGFNPANSRIVFANTASTGAAGALAALQDKLYIDADGTVSLGSTNLAAENLSNGSGYKLKVFGKAIAEEVRVQVKGAWPDYVFASGYALMPLAQLERFIQQNSHLPNIPSAKKLEKEGTDLGEMQRKMMEKIEELTLYVIELKKELAQQAQTIEGLKQSNPGKP